MKQNIVENPSNAIEMIVNELDEDLCQRYSPPAYVTPVWSPR